LVQAGYGNADWVNFLNRIYVMPWFLQATEIRCLAEKPCVPITTQLLKKWVNFCIAERSDFLFQCGKSLLEKFRLHQMDQSNTSVIYNKTHYWNMTSFQHHIDEALVRGKDSVDVKSMDYIIFHQLKIFRSKYTVPADHTYTPYLIGKSKTILLDIRKLYNESRRCVLCDLYKQCKQSDDHNSLFIDQYAASVVWQLLNCVRHDDLDFNQYPNNNVYANGSIQLSMIKGIWYYPALDKIGLTDAVASMLMHGRISRRWSCDYVSFKLDDDK
jgi:hypothetical protein